MLKINMHNLWEHMCFVMHHNLMVAYKWFDILKLPTSYDVIYETLKVMSQESPEIKYSVTALNYVQEKTGLSRSCILKVFSELVNEKLISLQRGVLMKIKL